MKKNQNNLYQFNIVDAAGAGRSGLTVSMLISKDGGAFASPSNSITELDSVHAPGLYQIQFTQEECNCNVLTIQVSIANGTNPVILASEAMDTSVEEIWGHQQDSLAMNALLSDLHRGMYNWQFIGTTLALYNSNNEQVKSFTVVKDGEDNIIKVEPLPPEVEDDTDTESE